MRLHFTFPLLLALFALPAFAQQQPADVPPPPPMADNVPEPEVTIVRRGEDKIEEYRVNGKLYMMKVTPAHGRPYYLIDDKGDGKWLRQDDLGNKVSVPMWVITTF